MNQGSAWKVWQKNLRGLGCGGMVGQEKRQKIKSLVNQRFGLIAASFSAHGPDGAQQTLKLREKALILPEGREEVLVEQHPLYMDELYLNSKFPYHMQTALPDFAQTGINDPIFIPHR